MYVGVLPARMFVNWSYRTLRELPASAWNRNLKGPLQEQQALVTTEPHLQPLTPRIKVLIHQSWGHRHEPSHQLHFIYLKRCIYYCVYTTLWGLRTHGGQKRATNLLELEFRWWWAAHVGRGSNSSPPKEKHSYLWAFLLQSFHFFSFGNNNHSTKTNKESQLGAFQTSPNQSICLCQGLAMALMLTWKLIIISGWLQTSRMLGLEICAHVLKSVKAAKSLHLLWKQRQPALSPRSVLSLYS